MKIWTYRKDIWKAIEKLWGRFTKTINQLRVLFLLPHFDNMEVIFIDWNRLRISLPLDKKVMKESKEIMEAEGWICFNENMEVKDWYPYRYFKKAVGKRDEYKTQVEFVYFSHNEGSTCVRKEIGKETIERGIYEIVCKEGAKEGAL